MSLKTLLGSLPKSILSPQALNQQTLIYLPWKEIIPQLAQGRVMLPFQRIKEAVPANTFLDTTAWDQGKVEVPLKEILPHLAPLHLKRNLNQKRVEPPQDVPPLFGPRGEFLSRFDPQLPTSPLSASAPITILPPASAPTPTPPVASSFSAPSPAVQPLSSGSDSLQIPLVSLQRDWPEAVRKEIVALGLQSSALSLPLAAAEQALKTGKLVFNWKQLRAWLPEPLQGSSDAALNALELDLPMATVVPLFMARRCGTGAAAPTRPAAAALESIPDPFRSLKQPAEATPTLPTPPMEDRPLIRMPSAPAPLRESAPTAAAANASTTLASRIIGHCSLPGVAGMVLASPDGLPITSQLPPGLKGETVAAFLPPLYERLVHYAAQMQLGTPQTLCFIINDVPLQVYKVNPGFLAVLGQAGQALPQQQLSQLATSLNTPSLTPLS